MPTIKRMVLVVFNLLLVLSLLSSGVAPALAGPLPEDALQTNQPHPLFLPTVMRVVASQPQPSQGGWATVAGNPQRTSWTSEAVTGSLNVLWYRPIEAYISQNVQLIAADGLIFAATSRGLYALNAASGAVAWRFDTEMPLGNSPTVVNHVVYVAGYDRKLHALNAQTGQHLWEFTGASAGYATNPLVVDGMVILGNRDGAMYAVGAHGTPRQGQLIWKYQTGGPIHQTAAYKNGVTYFASNDQYAYAVSDNGALLWKSAKLPGDGMQSYWPVVFTDPITGNDMVVFSTASGYRHDSNVGTRSVRCRSYVAGDPNLVPCDTLRFYNDELWYGDTNPESPIGAPVTINEPWGRGKTVLNYARVAEYYENDPAGGARSHKPWRRFYVLLDTDSGQEFTFDSDRDGLPEYAPILPFITNSGNVYPPIVGPDGLLYVNNETQQNNMGRIMGWRVGTPYFVVGQGLGDAAEPQALSGGGSYLYRNLCCDRVGAWYNINNVSDGGAAWDYSRGLANIAPGYDQMWWFHNVALERLYGNYGTVNGIYHNHGDQNPIIPYQKRLYVHRSNAVIAFGSGTGPGKLPLLTAASKSDPISPPSTAVLQSRLDTEVRKIISAGLLRPGYYNAGQFNSAHYSLADYFDNPGESLYTLARAYPYVSASTQDLLRPYLRTLFAAYFDPVMYSSTGWAEGAAREWMQLPPEVQADLKNYPKKQSAGPAWTWEYPQYNFYAMWKYAQIFPSDAGRVYDLAKSKLQVPVPGSANAENFEKKPYELNGYIAGYIGFLKLQELAGRKGADSALFSQVTAELNRLQAYRESNFRKDSSEDHTRRTLNISRNFILLVPELGDYLNRTALAKMQEAIQEYEYVGPYWFVSRYNGSVAESTMQNLYDYNAIFQAKAYILKEPREELTKYLDVPAFARGDLFYMQNLIAAIEAPSAQAVNLVPVTGAVPTREPLEPRKYGFQE